MIKGLFETHLYVANLAVSVEFYANVLGLKQCYYEEERKAAFFWIGEEKQAMLGLWEKPKNEIDVRHFAFECAPEWILTEAVSFLKSKNLKCHNFLNNGKDEPMVFAWMPAVSIYFDDPDGHSLEFIGKLPGKSHPELEKKVLTYEDWLKITAAKI